MGMNDSERRFRAIGFSHGRDRHDGVAQQLAQLGVEPRVLDTPLALVQALLRLDAGGAVVIDGAESDDPALFAFLHDEFPEVRVLTAPAAATTS
jgi:hypothetical protein